MTTPGNNEVMKMGPNPAGMMHLEEKTDIQRESHVKTEAKLQNAVTNQRTLWASCN